MSYGFTDASVCQPDYASVSVEYSQLGRYLSKYVLYIYMDSAETMKKDILN